MAYNVTAIYNQITQSVMMIVVDASNLKDPSFNPPDCIQIPLDVDAYNAMDTEEVLPWIKSIADNLESSES